MLISLTVKNFAIIESLKVDFNNNMTVLTGETGAGKSLIIDAIGLLLGKKADLSLIRHGEQKASIEGIFSYEKNIMPFLDEHGISIDEDYLIIRREILTSGKSTTRVNGTSVSLSELSELGELLGDIHSQNDTLGLVNPKNYLSFLSDEKTNIYLEQYQNALKNYKKIKQEYEKLIKQIKEAKDKEEFLKYQIKEFEYAKLSINEEKVLKEELHSLNNYEVRINVLREFHQKINDENVLSHLYQALQSLSKLEKIDSSYNELLKLFTEKYYDLESICNEDALKIDSFEYDENRIEEINARLAIYSDLRRKYKQDTVELVSYYQDLKEQITRIENSDYLLEELSKHLTKAYDETLSYALTLQNRRKELASILEVELAKQFKDLELKNTSFEICFKENTSNPIFFNDGIDEIDFLVSFNKGEPRKPFVKVASGGEMSRFMLALKSIISNKYPYQFKVFDEIDHGVSGLVAYRIAEKIKEIAKTSQVLCITHLPQVAAVGKYHLKIEKKIVEGRTIARVINLSYEERINEIAMMIAKGQATEASINLATELLQS